MKLDTMDPLHDARYALELDLRYRVLRAPLGMGRHQVGFDGELEALHVIAEGGEPSALIGCVLFDFRSGRLRAMAVEPAVQRKGVGVCLVRRLETEVRARGVERIALHARDTAVGFYEKLGYSVCGEPFVEVGVAHHSMVKTL
jgi:GNAT superfamily N-acetyltransferase